MEERVKQTTSWIHNEAFFPKRLILDSSKLKEFADDNFKFDENGRKFSKPVENTVVKGEIVRNEQFLLLPLCFKKPSTADISKPGLVWDRVDAGEKEKYYMTSTFIKNEIIKIIKIIIIA